MRRLHHLLVGDAAFHPGFVVAFDEASEIGVDGGVLWECHDQFARLSGRHFDEEVSPFFVVASFFAVVVVARRQVFFDSVVVGQAEFVRDYSFVDKDESDCLTRGNYNVFGRERELVHYDFDGTGAVVHDIILVIVGFAFVIVGFAFVIVGFAFVIVVATVVVMSGGGW